MICGRSDRTGVLEKRAWETAILKGLERNESLALDAELFARELRREHEEPGT